MKTEILSIPINDLELLNNIKTSCNVDNDTRASWIGPGLPATDVEEFQGFAKWALQHLRMYQGFYYNVDKEKSYTILDIACGTGYNTNILAGEFKNSKIVGVDISKECIKFANEYNRNDKITFLCDDILSLSASGVYDYIFFLETLEHILAKNHHEAVQNLLNSLTPTGKLFLSTPNENIQDQSPGPHRGILNKERAVTFRETFDANIISVSYYNNRNLLNEDPLTYITNDTQASHYKIDMEK